MNVQGVKPGPALGSKNRGQGPGIKGVRPQTVDRFGGKSDEETRPEGLRGGPESTVIFYR
jgi:hypothetical protein